MQSPANNCCRINVIYIDLYLYELAGYGQDSTNNRHKLYQKYLIKFNSTQMLNVAALIKVIVMHKRGWKMQAISKRTP